MTGPQVRRSAGPQGRKPELWSASPDTRSLVLVGLLGGFTTFSSFSFDTLALVRAGHIGQAVLNVVGQVGLSLVGVWAGYRLAPFSSVISN